MILCRLRVKQDLRDSYFVDLIVVRAGLLIGKEMDSPWTLDSVDLIVLASSAFRMTQIRRSFRSVSSKWRHCMPFSSLYIGLACNDAISFLMCRLLGAINGGNAVEKGSSFDFLLPLDDARSGSCARGKSGRNV